MNKNTKKIFLTILVIVLVITVIALAVHNLLGKNNAANASIKTKESVSTQTPKVIEGEALNLLKILPSDIVIGDQDAPITIIEYASLSCPHCASFYSEGYSKLKSEYIVTGKVKFAYRDFPLNQPALVAGVLALCQVNDPKVDAQKYYDFVKVLFRTQEVWAFSEDFSAKLETIAKLDGMSSEKFNNCIKDKVLQERVLKSRLEASRLLQISSTPTFFINGESISGYGGYDEIKDVIDKKLGIAPSPSTNPAQNPINQN